MSEDPINAAIDAYRRAIFLTEPMRMKVWEERGLTVSQLRLTYLIRDHSNPSLGDLAEMLGISGATMSGLIDRLEKRGLVERMPDAADRRIVRVRLTPEGEELSSELRDVGRKFLTVVFDDMGPEASAQLASALDTFNEAVKRRIAERIYVRLLHGEDIESALEPTT